MKGIRIEGLEMQLEKLERGKTINVSEVQDIKRQIEYKKAKKDNKKWNIAGM